MLRNENGFSYPLTFCIILAAFLLLSIHLEQYVAEKRLINETEIILKQEYYLISSMKKTEANLKETGQFVQSGIYTFSGGAVAYSTSELTGSLLQVTFKTTIGTEKEITGYGYYDIDLEKMIKWVEKN